jgi:chromosome partitioning protein
MEIITIANHKGGVGKTATTQNVGAGLAQRGFKVLLIDLDAQANLSVSFGIMASEKSIYEAFRGEIELPIYEIKDNLYIVPSNLNLSAVEIELQSQAGRDFFLKSLIAKMKEKYDYVLIDCPPSIGILTINALTASDKVIIPMEAHFLAVQGIQKIYEIIDIVKSRLNPSLSILGILVTKYDKRRILEREIRESMNNAPENTLFDTQIRNNVSIAEATYNGQDIFDYAPESNGAEDYKKLVDEILKL